MSLEPQDKKSLSDLRMAKAYEFLKDAEANYKEGRHKTSINRSYYAAFQSARSLLILEGSSPETHEGVMTLLSLRFVKPGLLPVDIIKKLKSLLSRRTDVDYGDFETTSGEDAEDSLRIAREVIESVNKARTDLIRCL